MTPERLRDAVVSVLAELAADGVVPLPPVGASPQVRVERPKIKEHGDYATSVALQLAKRAGIAPRELATALADRLSKVEGVAAAEVAGPGFVNIRVDSAAQGFVAAEVVAAGRAYGRHERAEGQRVNVEFVSANPTGPVLLSHSRWAAVGNSLARILTAFGAQVTQEYYFNDAGAQIDRFAASLLASMRDRPTPDDGYAGAYIGEIAEHIRAQRPEVDELPDGEVLEVVRSAGVALMFDEIKRSLSDFGVDFDVYFSERELHERGEVEVAVERLRGGGMTYEADGALWLRSTAYGDDKDRVLVRSDGRPTYVCNDAAYYLDKRRRGFDKVMILLGADHHGYLGRYRALAAAFGDDPDLTLELLIGQMVNLVRDGEPLRMSKRAGTVATLEDLVDALGVDAARYALVRYSMDATIDVDVGLWTRQSNDNPVFYVQYAHARMASVLRNAEELGLAPAGEDFEPALLSSAPEGDLLRSLADFPGVVAQAAELREPHRVARYLEATAAAFHRFYDECRVLPRGDEEPTNLHRSRLVLLAASRQVIANGLELLGVSAPDRM